MRKLLFTSLIDATLNRVSSFFSNVLMRRLATHVATNEAMDIAEIEERIAQLKEEGRPLAAERLISYLEDLKGSDPSFASSTSFGRQLLCDDYAQSPPKLIAEGDDSAKPRRRGRPRGGSNGQLAQS